MRQSRSRPATGDRLSRRCCREELMRPGSSCGSSICLEPVPGRHVGSPSRNHDLSRSPTRLGRQQVVPEQCVSEGDEGVTHVERIE